MERKVPAYTFEQVKNEAKDDNNAAVLQLGPRDRTNARINRWLFYLEYLLKKHAETGFILYTRPRQEVTKLLSYDEFLGVAYTDHFIDIGTLEGIQRWDGNSSQLDWERCLKTLAEASTFLYNREPRVRLRFVLLQLQEAAELARAEAEHVKEANRRLQRAVAQVSFWETKIPTNLSETGRPNENR